MSSDTPLTPEESLVINNWPIGLAAAQAKVEKTQAHLQRYQTALRIANAELEQRNRGITALTAFTYQCGRSTTPTALLKLALFQALKLTGASAGAIILIDETSKTLTLGVHKGLTPALRNILTGQELDNGATILMPHLVAGIGALLEQHTDGDSLEQQLLAVSQLTSLVSLPLQIGPKLMGALVVGLQDDKYFSAVELHLLLSISHETALALENLRLREGLWFTAEALLGDDKAGIELQQVDEADLTLDMPTSFELPTAALGNSKTDRYDVSQLLKATVAVDKEVQQQYADLQTLNTIAEIINRSLDLSVILQSAVEQTKVALQTDAAWLYLMTKDNHLEIEAHTGLSTDYLRGMQRLQPNEGVEGFVVAENKSQFISSTLEESHKHKIWVDKEKLQALAVVPITRPDQNEPATQPQSHVIGVLIVGHRAVQSYAWSEREMRLLTSIANQIAPAIDNARLYAKVRDDEAGQRTGNEILRALNDMLIEKNAFLEGFTEQDLAPALLRMSQLIDGLTSESPAAFSEQQKQAVIKLHKIVRRLTSLAQETGVISSALNAEFGRIVDDNQNENPMLEQNKPLRLS